MELALLTQPFKNNYVKASLCCLWNPQTPLNLTKKNYNYKVYGNQIILLRKQGRKPLRSHVEVVSGVHIEECHSHLEQQRLEVLRCHREQLTLHLNVVTIVEQPTQLRTDLRTC